MSIPAAESFIPSRSLGFVVGLLVGCAAIGATSASASVVTIGSPKTLELTQSNAGSPGSITLTNLAVGEPGAVAAAPSDGVIVRWRVTDFKGGPFYLQVLRPGLPGQFLGAGTSAPASPLSAATEVFPTSLPIRKGDLIGIVTTNKTDEVGAYVQPGGIVAAWSPALGEGVGKAPAGTVAENEIAFNAEMQPVPAVSAISPAKGSIRGGTEVSISGHDLGGATSVKFNGVPAATFPGGSDDTLSVVAPKATKPGPVDVTVTTPGGTSPIGDSDRFTYTACVVPKLKGKTLKSVKKALKKKGCKLGRATGDGEKIVKQTPKAGKILPPGSKVNVKKG